MFNSRHTKDDHGGTIEVMLTDPLPTSVLKDILPEIMPFVADMCNASLQDGRLPVSQRHAVVTPRLKKANADPQMLRTTDRSPTSLSYRRLLKG